MSILIIGECLSQADNGTAFSDGNGRMLKALLSQSGIDPRRAKFLNVFPATPPSGSSVLGFFGPKSGAPQHIRFLRKGKYIQSEHWHHVERIRELVNFHRPNLILACGDAALWALTAESSIKNSRGRIVPGNSALPNLKVLPVYSTRMIQSDWKQRPILLADLAKARREMDFPEIRRPQHFIHLYPSLDDMEDFLTRYIEPSFELSVDIETKTNKHSGESIITCVGFAPSTERAIVIPFFSEATPGNNYWPTDREEVFAWQWIKRVLRLPKNLKGQNFQYDMQHLWRFMGIPCPHFNEDTMILHHSLQPEMPKALGFLASIYTDEVPWKFMHKIRSDDKGAKKEDSL